MGEQLCGRRKPKVLCPFHGRRKTLAVKYRKRENTFLVPFQLYIALMSIHALFLALSHFVSCLGTDWHGCPTYSPPATIVFLLFLIFEGLLFSLFTSIMFGTQVSAIWYDETVSLVHGDFMEEIVIF